MTVEIAGVGPIVQGKSKKTGRDYYGQSISFIHARKGIQGSDVSKQFISFQELEEIPNFKPGQQVFLDYDNNGYLLDFQILNN